MSKTLIYSCDFETSKIDNKMLVVKSGCVELYNNTSPFIIYDNIADFYKFLLKKSKQNNIIAYFHFLTFDGNFLINFFDKKKIKYKAIISETGLIYQIKMLKNNITFKDSYSLIPFTLKKIANDFNFEIKKGNYTISSKNPKEFEKYFKNDLEILKLALEKIKVNSKTPITIGSIAFDKFKKIVGKEYYNIYPRIGKSDSDSMRPAYSGGLCICKKNCFIQKKGAVFDINSAYPFVCCSPQYPLPYGDFEYCFNLEKILKSDLFIIQIELNYIKLKKNKIECIKNPKAKTFFNENWIKNEKNVIITITNYDLKLLNINYNYQIKKFNYGIVFKADYNKKYLNEYMQLYYTNKQNSMGAEKVVNKLMLNALTGKFGIKNIRYSTTIEYKNDIIKFKRKREIARGEYLPLTIFITSIQRYILVNHILNNYKNFYYCDTDSLHIIGQAKKIKLSNKMGDFKVENTFTSARYIKQKTYFLNENEKCIKISIAGLGEKGKKYIENMKFKDRNKIDYGFIIPNGKLINKKVKGGIELVDTDFTINET